MAIETQQELNRIYRRDGVLVPAIVVDEARPDDSPLHQHFTWDDGEAADEWRREQARRLIRTFKIVLDETTPPQPINVNINMNEGSTVPEYMNLTHPATGLRGYYRTQDLLTDEQTRPLIFDEVRKHIASLRRKYQHLVDFDAVLRSELDNYTATQNTTQGAN